MAGGACVVLAPGWPTKADGGHRTIHQRFRALGGTCRHADVYRAMYGRRELELYAMKCWRPRGELAFAATRLADPNTRSRRRSPTRRSLRPTSLPPTSRRLSAQARVPDREGRGREPLRGRLRRASPANRRGESDRRRALPGDRAGAPLPLPREHCRRPEARRPSGRAAARGTVPRGPLVRRADVPTRRDLAGRRRL